MAFSSLKKVTTPLRWMGAKSTTTVGPVLYFEYGEFSAANLDTTGELPTDLTDIILIITMARDANGATALAGFHSDKVVTSGAVTVNFANPTADVTIDYIIIGTANLLD